MGGFDFVFQSLVLSCFEGAISNAFLEVLQTIRWDVGLAIIETSLDQSYRMLYKSRMTPIVFAQLQ